jgi:dethiobiotin synthetase
MKEIYFITATNTNIGKTKASEIFLKHFASKGKKVGYLKPIETGVNDIAFDGEYLLNLTKQLNKSFENIIIDDIVPFQFKLPASPFVASNGQNIDIDIIKQRINKLLKYCDILIIEGAGGLMVPINKNYFMYNLIKDINPTETILISPSYLGNINDTLLSQNLLTQHNIKFQWYINLYKDIDEFKQITLPFYKAYFGKIKTLQEIQH